MFSQDAGSSTLTCTANTQFVVSLTATTPAAISVGQVCGVVLEMSDLLCFQCDWSAKAQLPGIVTGHWYFFAATYSG